MANAGTLERRQAAMARNRVMDPPLIRLGGTPEAQKAQAWTAFQLVPYVLLVFLPI
jgi:hypothetical protein